ncbi:hypothetical protein HKK55_24950 [Pseudomonas sp. ADAK18]|uniref:hypothetical protein n=1 Tax=Pseudomonas sp. ADAK18 TaxID=2730848 RepID=UPI00146374D5|nr:hypothetical protein [Pseudomonas sp. ADAK18]QJI31813.1 hypothetical protein HKK55_24950 [Pseudomonas sp. ADAK18]
MINEALKAYVEKADGDSVRVRVIDHTLDSALRAIGFSQTAESDVYVMDVLDDKQKAQVFDALRSLEVAFSAGKEWCPAEVFEYLRDDLGFLSGGFLRVAWTAPGQYRIDHA